MAKALVAANDITQETLARALESKLKANPRLSVRVAAVEAGVNHTTFYRALRGRGRPNSENLLKLAVWAGLLRRESSKNGGATLLRIERILREDPTLPDNGVDALLDVVTPLYQRLQKHNNESH